MKKSPDCEDQNIVVQRLSENYPILTEVIPVEYYARAIRGTLTMMTDYFQLIIIYTFLIAALTQFLSKLMSNLNIERELGILQAMWLTSSEVFQILLLESTLLVTTGVS